MDPWTYINISPTGDKSDDVLKKVTLKKTNAFKPQKGIYGVFSYKIIF